MKILVCNFGSSSLKMSLFQADDESLLATAEVDWSLTPPTLRYSLRDQEPIQENLADTSPQFAVDRIVQLLQSGDPPLIQSPDELAAIGHRVVHGGAYFQGAALVDESVKQRIRELSELAPLHQPSNLLGIELFEKLVPSVQQFTVFDTSFHSTLPESAFHYPVPYQWAEQWGIRRFGFHGLSHQYCAHRTAELLGREDLKIVVAHLGSGASMSAIANGVCQDTSMGFTPLAGLMMGTRCGSIDPGILLYLLQNKGLTVDQVQRQLEHESGLLGMSGIAADLRQVLDQQTQSPRAKLAIDVYVHRIRQTLGGMIATLQGIDALVFTAGVGEHSAEIRRRVCDGLQCFGIQLDEAANENRHDDRDVALASSACRVLVIRTREDLTVLRQTRSLLKTSTC